MHWGHNTYTVLLPKMHNLSLTMRNQSSQLKLRGILYNSWPVLFKNVNVIKDMRNCSRLKETKYTWWPNTVSDPTGFWIRKELQNWMWTVYETSVLYQSSIRSLHCAYVEECHCTSGIHVEVLGVTMSAIYPGMVQKQGEELSWWGKRTPMWRNALQMVNLSEGTIIILSVQPSWGCKNFQNGNFKN